MHRLLPLAALVAAVIALPSAAQGATLERYPGIPGTMLLTGGPARRTSSPSRTAGTRS